MVVVGGGSYYVGGKHSHPSRQNPRRFFLNKLSFLLSFLLTFFFIFVYMFVIAYPALLPAGHC